MCAICLTGDSNHHIYRRASLLTHTHTGTLPFEVCQRHNECRNISFLLQFARKKTLAQNKQQPNKITNIKTKPKREYQVIDVERNYTYTYTLVVVVFAVLLFLFSIQKRKQKEKDAKPHTFRNCMIHFEMVFGLFVIFFFFLFLVRTLTELLYLMVYFIVCTKR